MEARASRGFSLVELAITILVMGLVFAFAVPAMTGLRNSQQLRGTSEAISAQLRLCRENAIATGQINAMHLSGTSYHTHTNDVGGPLGGNWNLPTGITYYWPAGTYWEYRFTKDGRCKDAGLIILQDRRNIRDTISVQLAGMITRY